MDCNRDHVLALNSGKLPKMFRIVFFVPAVPSVTVNPSSGGSVSTLDVDWGDLELAFRDATGTRNFLDKGTGDVVSIVPGFMDTEDLETAIAREPQRFLAISPLDASHARGVMGEFLGTLEPPVASRFAAAGLKVGGLGPGGLTKCLALLREDEALLTRYYRFEQNSFWNTVEGFLCSAGVKPSTRTPGVELFEGCA